jgi:SAM-dependent methyltransferase
VFDKTWEDYVALHANSEPVFSVLPAVGRLAERTTWEISADRLPLTKPLDAYIAADPFPLPATEDREGYYGDRHFEYWLSGLEMALATAQFCDRFGVAADCYVELGSASGRVARHIATQDLFREIWAFDINWRHVQWINRYLPPAIKAVQNSSVPILPLPDGSVDCLSAMSVFTHIEVFELQWLAELRRVLKRGGIALITVVTEHQLKAMTEDWPMWKPIVEHPAWSADLVERLRQQGKLVLRWHADRSYSSNVLYDEGYIRNVWGRFFDIVEYRHQFPISQDFLVLRRS